MESINFMDLLNSDEDTKALADLIEQIISIPDESLNDETVEMLKGMFRGAFTPRIKQESVQSILEAFKKNKYDKDTAIGMVASLKQQTTELLDDLNTTHQKRDLLNGIFNSLIEIFDIALAEYNDYDFDLQIMLEEGARMPTYAHNTDAAADLYASEDCVVNAHSLGTMVKTGVHIALPTGWCAIVVPRSSIGMKTPLRLSNSQGVIDASYRGPIGVIYDNPSDIAYTIHAGDRIAQMYLMPVHHFNGVQVEALNETDRGNGGFGSTGK